MRCFCRSNNSKVGKDRVVGWILAILVVGLVIGGLVGCAVLHPFLYGLLVAAIVIVPLWLVFSLANGIINEIFGKRK